MLFAVTAAFANSTTITITPASGIPAAEADQNSWVLANFGSNYTPDVLESFQTYALGAYYSLSTAVGTFSVAPGSQPGTPGQTNGTGTDQFTILNHTDTPFCCRYNTTPGDNQWLDSNDITGLQLTTTLSNIFFFIVDVNNVLLYRCTDNHCRRNIQQRVRGARRAWQHLFRRYHFLWTHRHHSVAQQYWQRWIRIGYFGTASTNSGIQVAPTPEPSGWPVAAAALLAIALFKKYKARAMRSIDASA